MKNDFLNAGNPNTGELQYLELLDEMREGIISEGFPNKDRTGVCTYSVFGRQIRFNLQEGFPLFTHKQVFMRGIFEELLWFLRGDTNIKTLVEKGVHIWSDWRYKEYYEDYMSSCSVGEISNVLSMGEFEKEIVDNKDFAEEWGDIGKGYGYQWRNFGELVLNEGCGNEELLALSGFDQIEWVINEIKTNPASRRLIVSGWNPHDVADVDLPPCHTLFQLFVKNGKLSCQLYQRSADLLLGVPFNIASYALLTHLVALECGLDVGEFVWVGGDIHVYSNQMDGLNEILDNRFALNQPKIKINKVDSIYDYQWSDIEILDYNHLGKVKMPVAV